MDVKYEYNKSLIKNLSVRKNIIQGSKYTLAKNSSWHISILNDINDTDDERM
jgi:hypothetical protein